MVFFAVTFIDQLIETEGFLPVRGLDAFSVENTGTSTATIGTNTTLVAGQERSFDQIIGGKYSDNIPVRFASGGTNRLVIRGFSLNPNTTIEPRK
ncbi:MAG: hypothetical protein F9K23_15835 [Bacteroidetes bacterium]|nr:MAG: hypothetical protein F9K23_15835 [Bacteroidota bacterium]